jgi:hypothetical protein
MATPTDQFRLKLAPSTSYNFTVNWGDGTSEVYNQTTSSTENLAGLTHTYSAPGVYDLTITENALSGFQRIYFNGNNNTSPSNDDVKVTDVVQWGNPSWSSMADAFEGCTNLRVIATDNNSLSGVTNFGGAWASCASLNTFPLINTSNGTAFNGTWSGCTMLTSFSLINTLSGTNFQGAWYGCASLNTFPLINTSNGTNFIDTWRGCVSLKSFPLINTSNGTNFTYAWENCTSLNSFPAINTLSATNFSRTWQNCTSLSSFPLIDTSNVTIFQGTWYGCTSLSSTDFPVLNMSKMTNGSQCFQGVKLTTNSYSTLLSSICATNLNSGVVFHGGDSTYNTSGSAARVHLVDVKGWTITDGGPSIPDLKFEFLQNSNFNTSESILNISKIVSESSGRLITDTIGNFAGTNWSEPVAGAYTTFRRVSAVSTSNNFDYTFLISVYGWDWIMRRNNKTSTWVGIKEIPIGLQPSSIGFFGTDNSYLKGDFGSEFTWDQVTLPDSYFINNVL